MPARTAQGHDALHDAVVSLLANERQSLDLDDGTGFDAALWKHLEDFGVPGLGLPDDEGSLSVASVVAAGCGRFLAPVPLVETCVAERLLARLSFDSGATRRPSRISTLGLLPAVDRRSRLVPAGAIADLAIALDGDDLVVEELPARRDLPAIANLATLPLADVSHGSGDRRILASGAEAKRAHDWAVAEWKAMAASLLVGVAARALELAVNYARDRVQFGVPIGTFQVIQHRLADVATEVDGADLLASKAVWSLDHEMLDAEVLASMAFVHCGQVAQRAAEVGVHVHGGYGFSSEYEIQHFFRWAKAWSVLAGDPTRDYGRIAASLIDTPR